MVVAHDKELGLLVCVDQKWYYKMKLTDLWAEKETDEIVSPLVGCKIIIILATRKLQSLPQKYRSRELSLAITKAEECLMWLNKAQEPPDTES